MLGSIPIEKPVQPAPTPRATIARLGGTAQLYHFHRDEAAPAGRPSFETRPADAPQDERMTDSTRDKRWSDGVTAVRAEETRHSDGVTAVRAEETRREATGRLEVRLEPRQSVPLLVVPSLINRWYIVDLRRGRSLCGALVAGGIDTFCLDWGVAEDEDRYLTWDELIARIRRAVNAVRRATGAQRVGLLGYCMGATVASIYAALEPSKVAAFVNLAGPIDFEKAGVLRELVDPSWFDADAIADAGNVAPHQMQSGFSALRPTLDLAKWVRRVAQAVEPMTKEARAEADLGFRSLEAWASDNVPFPGEAYRTYIGELYQQNRLVAGTHRVGGRRVDLSRIDCPVLTICASRDTICPADAATALGPATSARVVDTLTVPGGHVGAVVGSRAAATMYPAAVDWLRQHLSTPLHN